MSATGRIPAHLACLDPELAAQIVAHVAGQYARNPPPPYTESQRALLRHAFRQAESDARRAA